MNNVMAMVLAGGQGSRLSVLAEHRAKPAVPFGGIYRIIDFTMSNVMNSGIPVVGIPTQYKPFSLMDHISTGRAWGFRGRKHHAKILPPYQGAADSDWYGGTADAIFQNLNFIERYDPDIIIILSGDHIYKMNYEKLVDFHISKKADVTIAMQEVPIEDAHRFGVAIADADLKMIDFVEKSKNPPSNLASLGIYVFNRELLEDALIEDNEDKNSSHDFGKNVIPKLMKEANIFCYKFQGYWKDVGTLDAYWSTHQEILDSSSGLDLRNWDVKTNMNLGNLKNIQPLKTTSSARIKNSILSPGCIIEGEVIDSILSPGVHVKAGTKIEKSIIMDNSYIGENCKISYAIIDKQARIGNNCDIGFGESVPNKKAPHLLSTGLTVFGKNAMIPNNFSVGKNSLIYPDVTESDYSESMIPPGETIHCKSKKKNRNKK
jgi:glucose-1-phosphate adenylyltransferase